MEELSRVKKVKAFYEELQVLDELHTKAIVRLLKAKQLLEVLTNNREISKETLTTEEIKRYKIRKLEKVKSDFAAANVTLITDDEDLERYSKKKSKSKLSKKSTVEETFELWKQNNSIAEIATLRKLTKQTIYNHFAKLISSQTINISDVLPESKVNDLAEAFKGYTEETVNGLKEKHGD